MKFFPLAGRERLIKTSFFLFLIGFFAGLFANELKFQDVFAINLQQNINLFLPSIATLLAAYLGANYAFKLQVARQKKYEINKRVACGNKTIFKLIETYNRFYKFRIFFIEPHRNSPIKHYLIKDVTGTDELKIKINFDDLIFLVKNNSSELLTKLSFFQQKTNLTVDTLNEYSYIHHNHIQSRIMKLDPIPSTDQLDAEIDERYLLSAKSYLDFIIKSTDEIISLSNTLIEELNSMLRNEFPKHNILNLIPASGDKPKNE